MQTKGLSIQGRSQYSRPIVKIHRNDLCSCRSGKKYKNCCGRRNQIAEQAAIIEKRKKRSK
jgi:hypothetical protein